MATYARVLDGIVIEVILPAYYESGLEISIHDRYTPEFISELAEVNESGPLPDQGWSAIEIDGAWSFAPYVAPPPTPEQILAAQSAKLQGLTQLASAQKIALTNRIGTLNDAIELEMATPEEVAELPIRQAQLLDWKRYAVLLGRVTSQDGWPPEVEWPVQPAGGMDLSVSGVAPAPDPAA